MEKTKQFVAEAIKLTLEGLKNDRSRGGDDYHSRAELEGHVGYLNAFNGVEINPEELKTLTMDELYDRRMEAFAALVNAYPEAAFKSRLHADGTMFEADETSGWFVVGLQTPEGDYTYHYRDLHWDIFQCKELGRAPEWDGHMPSDMGRLVNLID